MDDGSVLETEWITEMRIRWSARCAEAVGGTGGDGGARLAAPAFPSTSATPARSPRHPQRGHPARQALPVGRRILPLNTRYLRGLSVIQSAVPPGLTP